MYTNPLLEEKYESQRQLSEKARHLSKDYLSVAQEEVRILYEKMGWKITFADRKGEWLKPETTMR